MSIPKKKDKANEKLTPLIWEMAKLNETQISVIRKHCSKGWNNPSATKKFVRKMNGHDFHKRCLINHAVRIRDKCQYKKNDKANEKAITIDTGTLLLWFELVHWHTQKFARNELGTRFPQALPLESCSQGKKQMSIPKKNEKAICDDK
ncbi:hypothetical protein TNIN_144221 [Trichonephila inaurata madagascariensis]|uniref:Uncharacterized protein n=1 Tax=Trichonephila inaurata madagascariensis TaxID=2747483 RepID=A0A8X6Y5M2_9ARAC|nr:hypothetical protein TNIN_144221 [Trichonephila inaurata madagascariensis]